MPKPLTVLTFAAALLLSSVLTAETQASQAVAQDNVTSISDLKRGTMATIHGKVDRILDTDEFRLSDDSGDIVVYIGWRNFVPVDVGDVVTIKGFVDDGLTRELYARTIVHADGSVTELHNPN